MYSFLNDAQSDQANKAEAVEDSLLEEMIQQPHNKKDSLTTSNLEAAFSSSCSTVPTCVYDFPPK